MASDFIKVRAEEVVIGAIVGIGVGIAVTSPITAGLKGWNPITAPGLTGFIQATALWLGIVGFGSLGAWWASRQERDSHARGARYLAQYGAAADVLQAIESRQFSDAQRHHQVAGIKIGGVEFSRTQEVGHIYVVGVPGTGKTVLLQSLVDQVLARGDRLILHDPKGDYIARYYDPASCVLIGPWDERAAVWDASADIDSPALADEFGASVAGKVEGQNKFFHDAAGKLIAGLIRSYQRNSRSWTWADLRSALSSDPETLIVQAAQGDASIKQVMPSLFTNSEDMTAGERSILSVLGTATSWIANYAAVDASCPNAQRFSMRRWMTGEAHAGTKIVVLNANANYQTAGESVFGSILATVSATVSSATMPERGADKPGIWCILDEFPQLGVSALGQIQRIAELGRSRGIRMVTALQDEAQLAARVGRDKAEPMLAVQSAKVYMRASDRTAEAVSKRIGQREINRIETTAENGALSGKTKKLVTQQVIQPSDLLGLRVRSAESPKGVELILHIEDTLGKLVQPFPERRPDQAKPIVESNVWKMGSLHEAIPE